MDHQNENELIMLVHFTLKQGMRDAFLAYTGENLTLSRAAAGNIAFDILLDEACQERVVFHEVWESLAAQQAYMAWRVERGDLATLLSYLADEPQFTMLRRLAT